MPHRPPLDLKKPLYAAREFIFAGEKFVKGDTFPIKDFSHRLIHREYEAHAITHEKVSPVEAEDAKGEGQGDLSDKVELSGGQGGNYTVSAPWLAEPEAVKGKKAAEARVEELRKAGPPEGWAATAPTE